MRNLRSAGSPPFGTMASAVLSGASNIQVYSSVYASSPRATFAASSAGASPRAVAYKQPALAVPHMQHHFGYGWADSPTKGRCASATSWQLHGDRSQQSQGLGASPHPFLKPSQRLHGCVLDAGLPDMLPPRASRKPTAHPNIKPHEAHVMSWPGTAMHVPPGKHHFRPDVASRNEIRGELPPMAQLLISPGSRPGFPTCARFISAPQTLHTARHGPCVRPLTPHIRACVRGSLHHLDLQVVRPPLKALRASAVRIST